ncbi:MAG: hypothetical protein V4644_02965 [Patescibacteria group bacterium]
MITSVIQPIVLVGMSTATAMQVRELIGSFATDSWEPQFLRDGDPILKGSMVLVSCPKETPTSGNYLQIILRDHAEVTAALGVTLPALDISSSTLVLVKQARKRSDGTYAGKQLERFTNALRVALKVHKGRKPDWRSKVGARSVSRKRYSPFMGTDPVRSLTEEAML